MNTKKDTNKEYIIKIQELIETVSDQEKIIELLLDRLNAKYKAAKEYNEKRSASNNLCSVCFLHVNTENEVIDRNNGIRYHSKCIN